MLKKTEKSFQETLEEKNMDLYDLYDNLRIEFLDFAKERNLEMEFEYENQSGREIPDGFLYDGKIFSIRETKFFQTLTLGSLDNLKEIFDNPALYAIYLEEVFGSIDEYIKESQKKIELGDERKEQEKEAA